VSTGKLTPEVRSLLERPNYVHLATVMPDGSPHSVPIWAAVRGDRIAFYTGSPSSQKARNLARDPRVSLSVVDFDDPYEMAHIRGRVVETVHDEPALEVMDEISHAYTGAPFPLRAPGGTLYLVQPERVGYGKLPFTHRPGGAA
jgi:PPOX class probable F420-dependent enzyme